MAYALPHVHTSLGDVRKHTGQVAEEIAAHWLLYFIWGIGASGEHKQGRALDFMTYDDGTVAKPGPRRDHLGVAISNYLVANHTRLGIWYVIWNRRIWSINYLKSGWRPYDGTNPHIDHVHVSFLDTPPPYVRADTPKAAEAPMPTLADIEALVRKVVREESTVHVSAERQGASGYAKATYDAESILLDCSWRIREVQAKLTELETELGKPTP